VFGRVRPAAVGVGQIDEFRIERAMVSILMFKRQVARVAVI
jgi:hypothetical protein